MRRGQKIRESQHGRPAGAWGRYNEIVLFVANRQEAEKVCPRCEKIIGYETPMTTMRDKAGLPWIWHNFCAEVDEENRQKALKKAKVV